MIETAAQEIRAIHSLLLNPTPEGFQEVTCKLGNIIFLLENIAAGGNAPKSANKRVRTLLSGLPREMNAIRSLMEAAVKFYEGLQSLSAAAFGSYERTGTIRSLEPQPCATRLIHL